MNKEFRHYYPHADLTKFDISDKYGVSFDYKGMGYDVFKDGPSGELAGWLDKDVMQAMTKALGSRSSSPAEDGLRPKRSGGGIPKKPIKISNFPPEYLLSNVKYPIRHSDEQLNYDLKLKISTDRGRSPSPSFVAAVRNVFTDVPIEHTTFKESQEWLSGPNMRYWPQQLNFAVCCATSGCGVGYDMMKTESFMMFHFHFTVRRILYELSVALPGDSGFGPKDNPYSKAAYQRLCKEFKIPENTDFRFPGYNHGLGYAWGYWGPKLHRNPGADYQWSVSEFNQLKDKGKSLSETTADLIVKIYNDEATTQYFNYLLPKGKGLTVPGLARINRSIEAFVYCILGAQVNTRSTIVGVSGSAQETRQEFLVFFESAVIENDISKSIQRYQLAVQNAKQRLDFALSPGCWLFPSNLVINTGSIPGYNNKLQRVTKDMKFGINDVNQRHKKIPHFVSPPKVHLEKPSELKKLPSDRGLPLSELKGVESTTWPQKISEPDRGRPPSAAEDHTFLKMGLTVTAIALGYYIVR